MKNKNSGWLFILYLYTFFLIYRPNLSPWLGETNILYISTPIIYLLLILRHRKKLTKTLLNKKIALLILFLLISLLYLSIISLIQNKTMLNSYGEQFILNIIFIVIPNILFICFEFLNKGYDFKNFINVILNIGLYQSVIVILMLIFPQFRIIAMDSFLDIAKDKSSEIFRYRIYGFSSDFTFSMQIFQAFLMGVAILCSIYVSKKYIFYVPFLLLSSILNGRTGIIICIVSILLIVIFTSLKKRNIKNLMYILFFPALIFFVLRWTLNIIKSISTDTFQWIMRFYYESIEFLNGNVTGTYSILFKEMVFFPKGIELLSGTGHRVFGGREISYLNSDIGYINDIFIGGILFLIFFYIPVIKLIMSNIKGDILSYGISILCLLFLILGNIKGEIFRPNVIFYGIMFIKFFLIIFDNRNYIAVIRDKRTQEPKLH